ncbi:MAG: GldG family protein [Candidatus Aureabacteria bacterium]|nr:GldG family protein [Candidatus Auribacterota bacterium]
MNKIFAKIKKFLRMLNTCTAIFLAVIIVAMLGYLAHRKNIRFDLTRSKIHTLSEKTVNIAKGINEPLNIYMIFDPGNLVFSNINKLVRQYADLNKNITIEHIDPDKDPAGIQLLARKTKFVDRNCLILLFRDRVEVIRDTDIAKISGGDAKGTYRRITKFSGEETVSSAILKLIDEISPSIYFTTGHGEKLPDSIEKEEMGKAANILKRQNIQIKKINLFRDPVIPPDCGALIIAGPKTVFSEDELLSLSYYLDHGGAVFMLIDPFIQTGLEKILVSRGLIAGGDVVIDPAKKLPFVSITNLYIENFNKSHPATSRLSKSATLHPLARSINLNPLNTGYSAEILCATSESGWGETEPGKTPAIFNGGKERKGPVSIGAAVTSSDKSTTMRLVAFGDSDFCSNSQIDNLANKDLFSNLAMWCLNKTKLISIESKRPEDTKLILTGKQLKLVQLICIFILPGIALTCGAAAWIIRRK